MVATKVGSPRNINPRALQGREKRLNVKFLGGISRGRPGGYPGRLPGPKTFTPSLGAQENKGVFAPTSLTRRRDVHEPRGSQKNSMQENFGLISRSLSFEAKNGLRHLENP